MANVIATKEEYERVDQLLKYLAETTEAQRVDFCEALRLTGQQHVVNFIHMAVDQKAAADYGDNLPLEKHHRYNIDTNAFQLAKLIELKFEGFLDMIDALNCITPEQMAYLNNLPRSFYSCTELLAILRRRSIADYNNFVACLVNSRLLDLANFLQYGGAIADVHVELNTRNAVEAETNIVHGLLTSLAKGVCWLIDSGPP
jgi:hypothetical protein